ncbi:MAG: WYL domain-containing protein [bacterium]|nr:WYL domain-containing protein [bacterium]
MSSQRTARRLTRLLAMLPWVIANPGATVAEVCERFGYTPRQLTSDLNLVFVCGLPGYGPGDLMVAYVDEDEVVVEMADYFSSAVRLSAPEALTLLAAGMAVMSSGQAPAALTSGVDKLQRLLLPDAESALVVDLAEPELVGDLRRAATDGSVVHIVYTALGSGATTERDIESWTVFSTMGNWYVAAYCRLAGGERVFRIDRIQEAEPTGESFSPPAEPPPPVVRYSPGVDDVEATIRLSAAAKWISEYYPLEVLEEDGDTTVVQFSASDPKVVARLLVRLGGAADLIEGPEVAEALTGLRSRILARYES